MEWAEIPGLLRNATPRSLMAGLDRYVLDHIETGGFLRAVLENDLMAAISRAETASLLALPLLVEVLKFAPVACYGSPEKVSRWIEARHSVAPLETVEAPSSSESSAFGLRIGILNGTVPMSFQEAKQVLFRHVDTPGYLQCALRELDALPTTKAIKKAAREYLTKAARDFEVRKRK